MSISKNVLLVCALFTAKDHCYAAPAKNDPSTFNLPKRSTKAVCGSVLMKKYEHMRPAQRDAFIAQQIEKGNIPNFLRSLVPVEISATDKYGRSRLLKVFVTRDYLSVGCDQDYIRIPLTPLTAQNIANKHQFILPTTKLVDEIYDHATTQLPPTPLPPSRQMMSSQYIMKHNRGINDKLGKVDLSKALIAGDKKDIVITPKLVTQPKRVAIYGWHKNSAQVLQPLSLVHSNQYLDYSHGVRFIASQAYLDGKLVDLNKVLQDPVLTTMIQKDGSRGLSAQLAYK